MAASSKAHAPDAPSDESAPERPEAKGARVIAAYVKRLPGKPGVYRMISDKGDVLYVGKAKDLKKRVSSYTRAGGHTNRILRMISRTQSMEFVITETETEALLLEANLIRQLKPRYNVLMRDDKSFPHILITKNHPAPQLVKHRGKKSDDGFFFGPFASATAVNTTVETLQRAFLLRTCSDSYYAARTRPCLQHQIKRCAAPCVDIISEADYNALVDNAVAFMQGKSTQIQQQLSAQMEDASQAMDYERAAELRDRIRALSYVQGSQDINLKGVDEADVFAIHSNGAQACIQVFFFRAGQNWGNRAYFPYHDKSEPLDRILSAFIAQFYNVRDPAGVILTNEPPEQAELLAQALSTLRAKRVSVQTPKRGEKFDITAAAAMNAKEALARRLAETASHQRALEQLGQLLGLDTAPARVEVYDNSHIQGAHAVGAMVVATDEGFVKNQYRKFNIKTADIADGDDYAMMREVLQRRFARLKKDKNAPRPDLIILDGGKGQLSAVINALKEIDIEPAQFGIDIVAIAKPRRLDESGAKRIDRTMSAATEQLVRVDTPTTNLPERDPGLFFLQRLRDEAHRFAIGAHRGKRKKAISANPLDGVSGIGAKRKRALLNHFGSAKEIIGAKPQDLEAVEGISAALAQRIYDFFHES